MKKFLIGLLILIIFVTIVISGLILWANTTHQRLTLNPLRTTPLSTQTIPLDHDPQSLNFNLRTAVLVIKSGNRNQLQLTNIATHQFQIDRSPDTLDVQQTNATQPQIELGRSTVIILTMTHPHRLNRVTINQLNGTLKLMDLTTHHLNIHHHNGTTLARHLTVTTGGEITKDNGSTTLHQLSSDGLRVAVKTGQFKLNGTKQRNHFVRAGQHPLTLTSGSGQVRITQ